MKVKEEREQVGLKLNIQKTKIMASSPITSWQTDGETVETVADFISGGSKITVDGDCSHEIKRGLLLGRKVMTNLDSKGDQSWVFIGRTDVEDETPILWPPHVKSWLIWKDPDAGKDWGQEEKRTTEDEMDGWHHRLNGHGFGWTPGVGDGQGGLVCCGSWGRKESETTERLKWTELKLNRESFQNPLVCCC